MVKVRRANVILSIDDSEVKDFISQGFDVIDASGKVIKKSVPNDINTLKAEYTNQLKQIEELKRTISELTTEISELKAKKTTAKKTSVKKTE